MPDRGRSDPERRLSDFMLHLSIGGVEVSMESLILAQDERWRRASYMQVEREARACPGGEWRTGE